MTIRVEIHPLSSAGAWQTLEPVWRNLHGQSRNDALFLSWDWLELWWKHLNARQDESAHVCVAYEGVDPIGALLVTLGPVRRRPGLRLLSAQTAGFRLYDSRDIVSEYLDVVAIPSYEEAARVAILQSLMGKRQPEEFVVGWTRSIDQWKKCLSSLPRTYVREIHRTSSYQADLSTGFHAYVATLGDSTRRSVLHLRSRLESLGTVWLKRVSQCDCASALHDLANLQKDRWSAPALRGSTMAFHQELISRWADSGRIVITKLIVGDDCLSCLYDLRMGDRQYNIQLGFRSQFGNRVSLGLLHLGYAMESAAAEGVLTYDFLAGPGRKTDYKARLASSRVEIATIQSVTGSLAAPLYRIVDAFRRF